MLKRDILFIDKPSGITSYDVIRRLKRKFKERGREVPKLGHAGTLDPLATGLLIIGVGEGTKTLAEYLKLPKTYVATIFFGMRTDTGDIDGTMIEERKVWGLDKRAIEDTLADMKGSIKLPVPLYSAVKRGGKPLYKYARAGTLVELPVKHMEVTSAHVRAFTHAHGRAEAVVEFDVGSGTYIRSLAEELGRRLGYPATLAALRRTKIGNFDVKDAQQLKE